MLTYNLNVRFDAVDEETILVIMSEFLGSSFEYHYLRSFVPPNHQMFCFKHLSDEGVENVKKKFRAFNLKGGSFETVEHYG